MKLSVSVEVEEPPIGRDAIPGVRDDSQFLPVLTADLDMF